MAYESFSGALCVKLDQPSMANLACCCQSRDFIDLNDHFHSAEDHDLHRYFTSDSRSSEGCGVNATAPLASFSSTAREAKVIVPANKHSRPALDA
mmetsp:Transcript_17077/g.25710  ORF Transcript_17077/g.25710 Transcript_17077/m.25710 type:complete len:95 (-) Transcript_17077:47-331(-)